VQLNIQFSQGSSATDLGEVVHFIPAFSAVYSKMWQSKSY